MTEAVRVHGLIVKKGGKQILDSLSFNIKSGRIVGLLGPSGAGKTTLIRSLVGLQKISGGTVFVLGSAVGSASLRGQIGYMSQSVAVYDDLTAKQNLYYFASILGVNRAEADTILEQVELTSHESQLVSSLSGGQRTRVSLAIALLGRPSLLILDEPTVGLDPRLRRELWQGFRSLAISGATILVSSHVMEEASNCDELLLISDGKLLVQESPSEICRQTGSSSVEVAFLKLTEGAK